MRSPLADRVALSRDGFTFPVAALSMEKAGEYLAEVEQWDVLSQRLGGDVRARWNYPKVHLLAAWADEFVHEAALLDLAEAVVGPDLLVWSISIFKREARSASELAWHQDAPYFGWKELRGNAVRVWVALTPTSTANGTLRFARGMHGTLLPHALAGLSPADIMKGEEVQVQVDESLAVDVELEPGQASMHLPTAVHCSRPNVTACDRVCVAVDYVSPRLRPAGNDSALLVRGHDRFGHFLLEDRLTEQFTPEALNRFRLACSVRDRSILSEYRSKAAP